MTGQNSPNQRNDSLDILKGIGIILMIVAHTYGPYNYLWDAINSFHMPLFFIVSGYLYKQKNSKELFWQNFTHLIIPYFTACIIIVFLTQIRCPHNIFDDLEHIVYGLGPGWFLLAMFLARIEFNYILKFFSKWHFIISLIVSASICLYVSNKTNHTSFFSFYPSLASLVFISIGYLSKQYKLLENNNKLIYYPIITLWLITLIYGKVVFSFCIFKLNIIDFAGSISGVFIFYKTSQWINKHNSIIKHIFIFFGRYSLIILFFHTIDNCVYIWYIFESFIQHKGTLLTLITINRLLLMYICVKISINTKILRSFFYIKQQ